MRLLVSGAGGMLGRDVIAAAERAGHEAVAVPRDQLDVTDASAIADVLGAARPEAIVNCAAWTDVDGAEEHREQALAVNAEGAGALARGAAGIGARVLQLSSDYVFDGRPPLGRDGSPRAYLESDPTAPISAYGESKLAGERLVLAASPDHLVVRTAWLFGIGGRNFAARMLELAAQQAERGEQASVRVVSDQVGCPSWTGHLAPALVGLLERGVRGLVHLAGAGATPWSDFAREIFRQAEVSCEVQDITTAEIARPAPRPAWSVLESERAEVLPLPPWQDGLAGYLAARAGVVRA